MSAVPADAALEVLEAIVGGPHVLRAREERELHSQDVYRAGECAAAVVRPGDAAEVARVLAAATGAGYAVFVRGGGMSYTDAFLPDRTRSIVLDTARLRRVRELRADDLHATVEAGCTWAELDEALAPHGVRARFRGPMSGRRATLGGAMSQGAVTFGSGLHGPSATAALGFEVALPDGRLLRTGADAQPGHAPFFRHYGPDLTGLFTGDAGALGVKTAVTLQLEPRPPCGDGLAFAFDDFGALQAAAAEIARHGLATEVFGVETALLRLAAGDSSLAQDARALLATGRALGGLRGLAQMLRIAWHGRRFLADARHVLCVLAEARDARRLRAALDDLRAAVGTRGVEIANTMAAVTRATPFPDPMVLGPGGRRLLPLHAVVPHSRAVALHAEVVELLRGRADELRAHAIDVHFVYATVGASAFLYEPVIYWRDSWLPLHRATLPPPLLAALAEGPANPRGRERVEALRRELVATMYRHGAVHLQIGRAYPYARERDPAALALLAAAKRELDPRGLLNPGALGLDAAAPADAPAATPDRVATGIRQGPNGTVPAS